MAIINIVNGMTVSQFVAAMNNNLSLNTRHTFSPLTDISTLAEINADLALLSSEQLVSGTKGRAVSDQINSIFINNPKNTITNSMGQLVITFDDSLKNQYDNAFSILKTKNAKATFYLTMEWINHVGYTGYMTNDMIKEMYYKGMDMQDHGYLHPNYTGITDEQIISDLTMSNTGFTNIGLPTPKHFGYPFGSNNANTKTIVENYRETARGAYGNTLPVDVTLNTFNRWAFNAGQIDNIDAAGMTALKANLDTAKAQHKAVICYSHGVTTNGDTVSISIAMFSELIDYAISIGIDILTVDELSEIMF